MAKKLEDFPFGVRQKGLDLTANEPAAGLIKGYDNKEAAEADVADRNARAKAGKAAHFVDVDGGREVQFHDVGGPIDAEYEVVAK